jgi:acetolactate synthase-1/3 small subunit
MENNNIKEYIISVFTENHPGILYRISSVFLRRKINIETFKVSDSPVRGISLFTIVVYIDEATAAALVRQMNRIVGVLKAGYYTAEGQLSQEVALFKVRKEILRSNTIEQIARRHPFRMLQVNGEYLVLRKSGYKEEIDALRDELKERGLLMELSRSGSIILHRETVEETMHGIL